MEMIIMYNLIYRELLLDWVVVYCFLFVNKVCNVLFDGSISYVNDYKKWEMNKNKFMMWDEYYLNMVLFEGFFI